MRYPDFGSAFCAATIAFGRRDLCYRNGDLSVEGWLCPTTIHGRCCRVEESRSERSGSAPHGTTKPGCEPRERKFAGAEAVFKFTAACATGTTKARKYLPVVGSTIVEPGDPFLREPPSSTHHSGNCYFQFPRDLPRAFPCPQFRYGQKT